MNFFKKLKYKLEDFSGFHHFNIYLLGPDVESLFQNSYFFSQFYENFSEVNDSDMVDCNIVVLVGIPNMNQVKELKELYEGLDIKKRKLIYIKSGLKSHLVEKSYFLCSELNEHIPVDKVYSESPIDLKKINQLIINTVRE